MSIHHEGRQVRQVDIMEIHTLANIFHYCLAFNFCPHADGCLASLPQLIEQYMPDLGKSD